MTELTSTPGAWTQADVRALLHAYGRTPQALHVQQLKSWWFNLVLKIEADGETLVLRRYGVTPPEEVRWELAVLAHLRQHGFPVIAPLSRVDQTNDALSSFQGKPAILYPFIDGRRGCSLDWSLTLAQTAEAVARLHTLTRTLAVPYPRIQSGTDSPRIIRQFADWALQRGVASHEAALHELLDQASHALARFEARVAPYENRLPRGVVHHDAHCGNVLFRNDRLVALIDFDDAFPGYLVDDLAVMIADWTKDEPTRHTLDLGQALAVVREYERYRPLTAAERELLPDFTLLYLLCNAVEYVRGRLERGADSATTIRDSTDYHCYLHHAPDAEWSAALRGNHAR